MDTNCSEVNSDWILGRKSFIMRVVKHSNGWPREAANHCVELFKAQLDKPGTT